MDGRTHELCQNYIPPTSSGDKKSHSDVNSFWVETGLDNIILECNIVNIFYPSVVTYDLEAQKNRLIEMVLLSTHNICFG